LGTKAGDFPLTEHLAARMIALPFFARISDQQIARIKTALVEAIASL
jgi:dTDP-4-amino-4,6-dideoxygalactose transaminase